VRGRPCDRDDRSLRWLDRSRTFEDGRFWHATGLLICVAGWLVGMHLVDIALWAALYAWEHAVPDVHVAFYFSAVTYTTTGYGDVVLPREWRLVGGVEALTGILMCGWSTGAARAFAAPLSGTRRSR
jgi:voltage-gated potassium channel Kch